MGKKDSQILLSFGKIALHFCLRDHASAGGPDQMGGVGRGKFRKLRSCCDTDRAVHTSQSAGFQIDPERTGNGSVLRLQKLPHSRDLPKGRFQEACYGCRFREDLTEEGGKAPETRGSILYIGYGQGQKGEGFRCRDTQRIFQQTSCNACSRAVSSIKITSC